MALRAPYPDDVRVLKEARALAADGHEVHLLCLAREGVPEPATERVGPLTVYRFPQRERYSLLQRAVKTGRFLVTLTDTIWRRELTTFVETVDPDVLHVHDLPLVRTAGQVAAENDLPLVADLHENYPEAARQWRDAMAQPRKAIQQTFTPVRRLKALERDGVRQADHVLAITEEGRRHYIHDCGAHPDSVTVVSNTVDLDHFDGDADPVPGFESEFVIAYVGSFGPHRGLETAIDAMPAIVDRVPNARLLLVGGGGESYEHRLRERAQATGVDDHITFTGWVDLDAVPNYVATSDLPVVLHQDTPHTATTVPHKLFQYMAVEKPVAVTDVGTMGRIVREGNAGVVVEAGNADAFAAEVIALAQNPSRAEVLGENARSTVESRYNWAYDAATLRDVYGDLSWNASRYDRSVSATR
jgi:glycosyltransferase involved in cell wall biosynthesis